MRGHIMIYSISIKPPFELRRDVVRCSKVIVRAVAPQPLQITPYYVAFSSSPASWLHVGGGYEAVAALPVPQRAYYVM